MSDIEEFSKLAPTRCSLVRTSLPFLYVGQSRNAILIRHDLEVAELPFQAHPDIPPGGVPVGTRNGPMYANVEHEAEEIGLSLNWPHRLPDTRRALTLLRESATQLEWR